MRPAGQRRAAKPKGSGDSAGPHPPRSVKLPAHLWRLTKYWRGLRMEIPWVDRSPSEIVRDNFRLTIQPFDGPSDPDDVERIVDHLRSDAMLLYSSDFPHWQFDGDEALPEGLSGELVRKLLIDNPRETYPRLMEMVQ